MRRSYPAIDKQGKVNARKLGEFLSNAHGGSDGAMPDGLRRTDRRDRTSHASSGLELSAQQAVGGPRQQGKSREGEVVWYGQQPGSVMLSDRKLRVKRPRLRRKGSGAEKEVEVPAYQAMQDQPRLGARMLDILMRGVSTRQYRGVIPEMADTVGVSKSSVSR